MKPSNSYRKSFSRLVLGKIFCIWYPKHKQQKQKQTNKKSGTIANLKASAQQNKQSKRWKWNLWNGRKICKPNIWYRVNIQNIQETPTTQPQKNPHK